MKEGIQVLMQSRRGITQVRNVLIGLRHQLGEVPVRIYRDPVGGTLEGIGNGYTFELRERPLLNIPEVRNQMIEESKEDTCLLLDDDVAFEKDCLSILLKSFKDQKKHVVPWCRNTYTGSLFSRHKNMGVDFVSRAWVLNYAPFYGSRDGWMHSYYMEHWNDIFQVHGAVMLDQKVPSLVTEGYEKVGALC